MKKIFPFLFTFFVTIALAQEQKPTSDIKETIKEKSKSDRDRFVLQLTFDNWLQKPDSISPKWSSRGVGFYWMVIDVPLGNSNFSFAIGTGVSISNIFINRQVNETDSMTYLPLIPSSISYKRYKIVTTYLDIPVELRYHSKPDKTNNSWKVGLGFKGGLLINNHWKIKSKDALGDLTVFKSTGIKNLYSYHYGPTIKIGYGSFNIFTFYSLSTLFNKNKGPEISPFSIGLMISEF